VKVVHINTHDSGGAATAAYRLHEGLLAAGIQSRFLVLYNSGAHHDTVTFKPKARHFLFRKLKNRLLASEPSPSSIDPRIEIFTKPETVYDVLFDPCVLEADILHLHWVANFIDYQTFFYRNHKPVIWTFHDKNPFCGGFHYDMDRVYSSPRLQQLDKEYESIKLEAMAGKKFTAISPSAWLAGEVARSPFRKIFAETPVIPYGLDHTIFKQVERTEARQVLGITHTKPLLLMVAANLKTPRKGFDIVLDVMRGPMASRVEFAVVGEWTAPTDLSHVYQAGLIADPVKMNLFYNAADALLLSSREDNLPNVMIESLMRGTPVLGFDVGGVKEVVQATTNGLLTSEHSAHGLTKLIEAFLTRNLFDREKIRSEALAKFSMAVQVREVTKLYTKVINSNHGV